MSLIKTHHEKIYEKNSVKEAYADNGIYEIVYDLVVENPGLIVDSESLKFDQKEIRNIIAKFIDKRFVLLKENRENIITQTIDYMFGYGILQKYIDDEEISDIDGSRHDYFTVKRNGKKERIDICFRNETEFENYCKLLAIRNDGVLNECDNHARIADLNNRLRINLSISPRNITGPSINIRKHRKNSYTMYDLKALNVFSEEIMFFLKKIMKTESRIIISGKGAAGKTTLLRALLNEISMDQRILVCESDSELYPESKNFIVQKVKKENQRGRGIHLDTLIKDGLTMSLDGYCIGEIVGEEAWEFIKAGYTDHKMYGTVHSNSSLDTLERLIMLIGNSTNLAGVQLRKIVANSIDIVIYMKNFRVMEILQVIEFDPEVNDYDTEPLYHFDSSKNTNNEYNGQFVKVGEVCGTLRNDFVMKGFI